MKMFSTFRLNFFFWLTIDSKHYSHQMMCLLADFFGFTSFSSFILSTSFYKWNHQRQSLHVCMRFFLSLARSLLFQNIYTVYIKRSKQALFSLLMWVDFIISKQELYICMFFRVLPLLLLETILSCCLGIFQKKTCVLNVLADLFGAYMWVCVYRYVFFSAAVKATER